MPKNVQITEQLHSLPMLVRLCSKSFQLGFSSTWIKNFQIYKLGLEKAEELDIKLPTFVGSLKKAREFQKNIYFCFIDYTKTFDCVDCNKLWKVLKEMGTPEHLTYLLRRLYMGQEAVVRTLHGTTDLFKIGKEYDNAVYCHRVYLTYMQSISCKILGWMSYKLESRLLGKNQQPQTYRWYHSNGRKWRGTKEPLDEDEGGEWKSGLMAKYLKTNKQTKKKKLR